MAIEKVKNSAELIKQVEVFLENGLNDNEVFNSVLDGEELLEISSLQNHDQVYQYKASEVLYWVDRTVYLDELDNWNGDQLREVHFDAIKYISDSKQEAVFSESYSKAKGCYIRRCWHFCCRWLSGLGGCPSRPRQKIS